MKRLCLLINICLLIAIVQAQEFDFQVKLNPAQARTATTLQQNSNIKRLITKYDSFELKQCYPGAKNPELLLYYSITGKGETTQVEKELKESRLFDEIIEEEPAYVDICTSPIRVNDPQAQYGISLTETDCAWSISKGSSNIYLGFADTEFDTQHEDLIGKFVDVLNSVEVNNVHGTYTSGVAAAIPNNGKGIPGYSYNCRVLAHGIPHNSSGNSTTSTGIRDAIWNLYLRGVPVINVSWSNTGLTKLAAEEITQNGTTLVVTAGNTPTAVQHATIAEVPGVIVVTSVDADNNLYYEHARNKYVDICAPGAAVWFPERGGGYRWGWGTSVAAPCVTGIIGLMLEVNPFLTPAKAETIIKQMADPLADGHLYPGLVGAGRINAYKSVMQAGTRSYANTTFSSNRYLTAGYGFTFRNVTIKNNAQITLIARKEVEIDGPFEVALGSTFSIDFSSTVSNNGTD